MKNKPFAYGETYYLVLLESYCTSGLASLLPFLDVFIVLVDYEFDIVF